MELHQQIIGHQQNIRDLKELLAETTDKEEREILNEEANAIQEELDDLREQSWELLVPPAPYDNADDIILEFRPGAGGTESSIFVEDISSMFDSFCGMQGWRCTVSNSIRETGVSRGYKVMDLRVQGAGCHKMLKC